jgi:hypothetical protein
LCSSQSSNLFFAMKKSLISLLAFGLMPLAHAQLKAAQPRALPQNIYAEASINSINYASSGLSLNPTALRGILGKNLSSNFSYEGLIAFGTSSGEKTVDSTRAIAKIDPIFGGYIKARKELAPGLDVFARFGAASVVKKLSGTYYEKPDPINERMGSMSYGLGVKIGISRDASFVADYMSYYNRKQETIDGYSLGLALDF